MKRKLAFCAAALCLTLALAPTALAAELGDVEVCYTETTLLGKIIQQEASYCVKKVIHRFPPPARAPRQKKMQNRTFLPSSREPGECNSRCQRVVHVPYTHSGMEA